MWVIWRGSLQVNRKLAGVVSAHRRTRVFRRNSVERRVHFNHREMAGIKFQPMRLPANRADKRHRASLRSSMRTSRCVFSADRRDSNGIEKLFGFVRRKTCQIVREKTALKT